MKSSPTLLLIICILFFAYCKKKDMRNYSYWQVNQDKFSTNDVSVEEGKRNTSILCSKFVK
jgi:hypothetical protein